MEEYDFIVYFLIEELARLTMHTSNMSRREDTEIYDASMLFDVDLINDMDSNEREKK